MNLQNQDLKALEIVTIVNLIFTRAVNTHGI